MYTTRGLNLVSGINVVFLIKKEIQLKIVKADFETAPR